MSEEPQFRRIEWTTVFAGTMSEAIVCQGLLGSNGIHCRILDHNIKVIDPFITGGSALQVELQTPSDSTDRARELLDWRPPRLTDGEESVVPEQARVEKVGQRIRWSSVTVLTAPYALWLAPEYLLGVRRLGRAPRNHGWTLAAIAFSGATTISIAGLFLRR
jgi:hypothetical protein